MRMEQQQQKKHHNHTRMQKYRNVRAHENGESEELKRTSATAAATTTEDTNFNVQCKMI